MSSILHAFSDAFKLKKERGWDKIYVWVDIHKTILYPTYEMGGVKEFYTFAKEALIEMTKQNDISLGLYTCSYPEEIKEYLKFFELNGIHFEHINKNDAEENSKYGYFNEKPYFNVLIDDKAGFRAEHDWHGILVYLKRRS